MKVLHWDSRVADQGSGIRACSGVLNGGQSTRVACIDLYVCVLGFADMSGVACRR